MTQNYTSQNISRQALRKKSPQIVVAIIGALGIIVVAIINKCSMPNPPTPVPTSPPSTQTPLSTITLRPGTGFIFASEKMVDGCVADRDICWNGKGLVPNHDVDNRIYTLGSIPSLEGVAVDKGKFAYGQFPVTAGEGFVIEINRQGRQDYALLHILSVHPVSTTTDPEIAFEWLYPYGQ
ncbi:MAG: hypothetical protein U0350_50640 [Caldilineaceae bacterium]